MPTQPLCFCPLDTNGLAVTLADGSKVNIFSFFAEGSPPSGNAFGDPFLRERLFLSGLEIFPALRRWAFLLCGLKSKRPPSGEALRGPFDCRLFERRRGGRGMRHAAQQEDTPGAVTRKGQSHSPKPKGPF